MQPSCFGLGLAANLHVVWTTHEGVCCCFAFLLSLQERVLVSTPQERTLKSLSGQTATAMDRTNQKNWGGSRVVLGSW